MALRVVAFCWNTSGLRICETGGVNLAMSKRTSNSSVACAVPDFFEEIKQKIISPIAADIVVIVTEDEASTGSFFHRNYLQNVMNELNYPVYCSSSINVGEIASGVSMPSITGTTPSSFCNMTVFVSQKQLTAFRSYDVYVKGHHIDSITCKSAGNKIQGAIGCYLEHRFLGTIAIVGIHLVSGKPFNGLSPKYNRTISDCYNKICATHIASKLLENRKVGQCIILGDFNTNITLKEGQSVRDLQVKYEELSKDDGLKMLINDVFYDFKEGINGAGPNFPPNFRLTYPCNERQCYASEYGWHDRVIYRGQIVCNEYLSVTSGNIDKSDHSGCLAVLTIGSSSTPESTVANSFVPSTQVQMQI